MKTIKINMANLEIANNDIAENYTVISHNGSGLYTCKDENGADVYFERSEVKKMGDINKIDEALEMLFNKEYNKVYTDDLMNFIDESEFNSLDDEWKEDYEKVEFVVE